ncbi:hypothetical protein CBR_g18637 [Chara braunii]|uniref:Reverse transcriptase domain-containing protein n=1 Tax=Chara braunii TaxID=69332 RepID=A0A388JTK9_CHABU|nr:hypothetical protein CBR_g18637 [Chara braunii]|eukprot:GBG61042.1 hypothetical protein CBR_g18637 [Chara braunii]
MHDVEHSIQLVPDYRVHHQAPYRLSIPEAAELKHQLEELLRLGFIKPNKSSWGAPVLFARKADETPRLCIDYQGLNHYMVKNNYPMPRSNELFNHLVGNRFFAKIDLRSGYHQICVATADQPKTAFRSHFGHYEFTVMPFCLTNAPATFQRAMNDIFRVRDILEQYVLVYLDDILIYSRTLEEHLRHLYDVLDRLRRHDFYAKLSKCRFAQHKVDFLGHYVSDQGLDMDDVKTTAIAESGTTRGATAADRGKGKGRSTSSTPASTVTFKDPTPATDPSLFVPQDETRQVKLQKEKTAWKYAEQGQEVGPNARGEYWVKCRLCSQIWRGTSTRAIEHYLKPQKPCPLRTGEIVNELVTGGGKVHSGDKNTRYLLKNYRQLHGIPEGGGRCNGDSRGVRFGSVYQMLERIRDRRAMLKDMVDGRNAGKWKAIRWSTAKLKARADLVYFTLRNDIWWMELHKVTEVMEPVYNLLRRMDKDGTSPTNLVEYDDLIERKFAHIVLTAGERASIMDRVKDRIKMMRQPVHALAFLLDPYRREPRWLHDQDNALMQNAMRFLSRQIGGAWKGPEHVEIWGDLAEFHSKPTRNGPKRKNTKMWDPTTKADVERKTPSEWWAAHGGDVPELQKIAIKVMGMWSTASPAERNWASMDFVRSKRRNSLAPESLEKLVYIHWNMQLLRLPETKDGGYVDLWSSFVEPIPEPAEDDGSLLKGPEDEDEAEKTEEELVRERRLVKTPKGRIPKNLQDVEEEHTDDIPSTTYVGRRRTGRQRREEPRPTATLATAGGTGQYDPQLDVNFAQPVTDLEMLLQTGVDEDEEDANRAKAMVDRDSDLVRKRMMEEEARHAAVPNRREIERGQKNALEHQQHMDRALGVVEEVEEEEEEEQQQPEKGEEMERQEEGDNVMQREEGEDMEQQEEGEDVMQREEGEDMEQQEEGEDVVQLHEEEEMEQQEAIEDVVQPHEEEEMEQQEEGEGMVQQEVQHDVLGKAHEDKPQSTATAVYTRRPRPADSPESVIALLALPLLNVAILMMMLVGKRIWSQDYNVRLDKPEDDVAPVEKTSSTRSHRVETHRVEFETVWNNFLEKSAKDVDQHVQTYIRALDGHVTKTFTPEVTEKIVKGAGGGGGDGDDDGDDDKKGKRDGDSKGKLPQETGQVSKIKLKLPWTYNGKKEESVLHWAATIETYVYGQRIPYWDRVLMATSCMGGDAMSFAISLQKEAGCSLMVEFSQQTRIEDFLRAIRERFEDKNLARRTEMLILNLPDRKWKSTSALKATMDELLQCPDHGLTPAQILNSFARALPDSLRTQLYPRVKEEGITYEKFGKIAIDHAGFLAEANYCHYWKDLQAGKKWQNRTISGSIPGKDSLLITFEEGGAETISWDQVDYGIDERSGPVAQEGSYTTVVARGGGRQGRGRGRGRGRGCGGRGFGTQRGGGEGSHYVGGRGNGPSQGGRGSYSTWGRGRGTWWASGETYESDTSSFDIGRATGLLAIHDVTSALLKVYPATIKWPTGRRRVQIMRAFREKGFPNCYGAINYTHIHIDKPADAASDNYYDHKQKFSVQAQVVVDLDLRILNVHVGYPGSVHDVRVLHNSHLWRRAESGELFDAPPKNLLHPVVMLGYLLGDNG